MMATKIRNRNGIRQTTCLNVIYGEQNNEMNAQNVGSASVRSRNGAPSRKSCVVHDQVIKASNKRVALVYIPTDYGRA